MVECPDCGLKITRHNLKYTHKRYCKALKEQESVTPNPSPASSSIDPPKAPPAPPVLQRTKTVTNDDDVNEYIKNNPEVITNYLRNERANKANKRQFNARALLNNAF